MRPMHRCLWIAIALALTPAIAFGHPTPDGGGGDDPRPLAAQVPPDVVAPAAAGTFAIDYRYQLADDSGVRDGRAAIALSDLLEDYPASPTGRTAQTHTLALSYAPHAAVLVEAWLPIALRSMDHALAAGGGYTTSTRGLGDAGAGATAWLFATDAERLYIGLSGTAPMGSIEERDDDGELLPYPMQLGAGTPVALPRVGYLARQGDLSWGGELNGELPLGDNDRGYRPSRGIEVAGWSGWRSGPWLGHARVAGRAWGDLGGADGELDPTALPINAADRYAGVLADVTVGAQLTLPGSIALAIAVTVPVFQDLDGPQLERGASATASVRYSVAP